MDPDQTDRNRYAIVSATFEVIAIIILYFLANRSWKTLQTQISLFLEEQSDQGLHSLLFHLHLFGEIP